MITGNEKVTMGDNSIGDAFVDLLRRFDLPYGVLVISPMMTGGNVLRCAEGIIAPYSVDPAVLSIGCDAVMQVFAGEMGKVVGAAISDPANSKRITGAAARAAAEGN